MSGGAADDQERSDDQGGEADDNSMYTKNHFKFVCLPLCIALELSSGHR
ncbi:MAG: hypothetical protein K6D38_03425 [Pseudobutyrivibrio sp.]|nr:hypothetical protein [Pseudobutyrivibrio sp.]